MNKNTLLIILFRVFLIYKIGQISNGRKPLFDLFCNTNVILNKIKIDCKIKIIYDNQSKNLTFPFSFPAPQLRPNTVQTARTLHSRSDRTPRIQELSLCLSLASKGNPSLCQCSAAPQWNTRCTQCPHAQYRHEHAHPRVWNILPYCNLRAYGNCDSARAYCSSWSVLKIT